MGFCPFCYYGWPKPIVDIYRKYAPIAGESAMHYGAAHIVWDDENFGREPIQWCLDNFEKYKRDDCTDAENEAVRESLKELLLLSDDILNPFANIDCDASPDTWAKPEGIEFVRV